MRSYLIAAGLASSLITAWIALVQVIAQTADSLALGRGSSRCCGGLSASGSHRLPCSQSFGCSVA
jgi:hypothetical protein